MKKSKVMFVVGLVSAAVCCFADGLPWMTPKAAPTAAKGDAEMQNLDGILIETLGGQRFEKREVNGVTAHVAILPTPSGIHANANVIFDAHSGTLLSMEEYAQDTKKGYASMGLKSKVKEQDDDVMIVTASNDQLAYFVKVIREECKNRFVVVTGTVVDQGAGALAQSEVQGIANKIERCVRSARKEGSGTGGAAVSAEDFTAPAPLPPRPTTCKTKTRKTADASMEDLNWIWIERFDGQPFEKKSENGKPVYYAKLAAPAGLEAVMLVLSDTQHGGSLPSMDEYAKATKQEFAQKGLETTIKEQDDESLIITASNNEVALFIKALRDVGNSQFVVVMGTLAVKGDASNVASELKEIAGKIERCVRSARLK